MAIVTYERECCRDFRKSVYKKLAIEERLVDRISS